MDVMTYIQQMLKLAIEGKAQGIWFWASIYVALCCIYSLWFQIRTRSWPTTEGQLLNMTVEKIGGASTLSEQDYIGTSLYTYSVNGEKYEGSRISPWVFVASHNLRGLLKRQMDKVHIDADNRVRVYYNPRTPRKSFLIVASRKGILLTALLGVMPLAAFWFKYHA